MKSEKAKGRKSLYIGVVSIVIGVSGLANYGPTVLFCFASAVFGIVAVIIGKSERSKSGVDLGVIGVGLSMFIFFGTFGMAVCNLTRHRDSCLNLNQTLNSMIKEYCEQNEGHLPDADAWCDQLLESVKEIEKFPMKTFSGRYNLHFFSDSDKNRSGFAFNKKLNGHRVSDIDSQTVLLFETDRGWNQNGTSADLLTRAYSGYWPFFEDGHYFFFVGPSSTFTVEFIKNSEIDDLKWEPGE